MNFLEAFEELNQLNEGALTEKFWVAINPNGSQNYYKFLTVDNKDKRAADIADMLGPRRGTYKQMLDKDVLKNLVYELTKASRDTNTSAVSDPKNYTLYDLETVENTVNKSNIKTLTLGDRYLRHKAHPELSKKLSKDEKTDLSAALKDTIAFQSLLEKEENEELAIALKDALEGQKYLIHHINGNEAETTPSNVVLIPYEAANKDDLKIANGIHGVLHGTSDTLGKGAPVTENKLIFYFENGELRVGKCHIEIAL